MSLTESPENASTPDSWSRQALCRHGLLRTIMVRNARKPEWRTKMQIPLPWLTQRPLAQDPLAQDHPAPRLTPDLGSIASRS
jgi:hypothetical protein